MYMYTHCTLAIYLLPWLYLAFTVEYGLSEVEPKVVVFDPTNNAILPCSTDAKRVFWTNPANGIIVQLRNDEVEKRDERYDLIHKYENERNLLINGVKKQDAGIYSCYAGRNLAVKYNLIVNYEAEIPFSSNGRNDVRELSTVGLWCNATGMPAPKTTWYVLDESGKEHPLGFTGRYLEVRNVTRGCSATYRCKSTNRLNEMAPAVVDMRVNAVYPPEIDISLDSPEENVDNFTFDDSNIEYTVYYRIPPSKTSTVVLTCHVSANPNATISWQVGNQVIANYTSGDIKIIQGQESYLYELALVNGAFQITIKANGDHDILFKKPAYKCESTNRIGGDRCSVRFKPAI